MRWKLANGSTVASTKQPVQWKDFDRIEISDDYQCWYEDYGTFDDNGGPPAYGDIEFTIDYYNPSTHTIKKSYSNGEDKMQVTFGTDTLGHTGGGYSRKDPYIDKDFIATLTNLSYGATRTWYVYPRLTFIRQRYSGTVNPFEINWYNDRRNFPEHRDWPPYRNYFPNTYTYWYEVQFKQGFIGGGPKSGRGEGHQNIHRFKHSITYKVH